MDDIGRTEVVMVDMELQLIELKNLLANTPLR